MYRSIGRIMYPGGMDGVNGMGVLECNSPAPCGACELLVKIRNLPGEGFCLAGTRAQWHKPRTAPPPPHLGTTVSRQLCDFAIMVWRVHLPRLSVGSRTWVLKGHPRPTRQGPLAKFRRWAPLTLSLMAVGGVGCFGVVRPPTVHNNAKLMAPLIGCNNKGAKRLGEQGILVQRGLLAR